MTPPVEVVVVGDAMLDVLATPSRPPVPGSDVPARIQVAAGGQGANLAVRLARQGIAVGLVAPVGADAAGGIVRVALADAGARHLGPDVADAGVVVVLRDPDGERTMLSRRIAFGDLTPLREAMRAAWVVVSGYALLDAAAAEVVDAAAPFDRRAVVGCALSEGDASGWGAHVARMRPHLLVLNRDEARVIGEAPTVDVLVVTDARGAVVRAAGTELRADVPDGPPAVDTTGAGDAFAAGFIAELARSSTWPPDESTLRRAAEHAVRLAAAVARVAGAQTRVLGEAGGTLPA